MNEHDERDTIMTGVDPSRLDDQQLMKELETMEPVVEVEGIG